MRTRNGTGRLIVFILLGLILGGILGESFGLFLSQVGDFFQMGDKNFVRDLFVHSWELDLGIHNGGILDLYLVKLRLGIAFKFNLVSILGVLGSLYIMKWSGDR